MAKGSIRQNVQVIKRQKGLPAVEEKIQTLDSSSRVSLRSKENQLGQIELASKEEVQTWMEISQIVRRKQRKRS